MTVEEEELNPTPQDAGPRTEDDLKTLVQALVTNQALVVDQAKAAKQRSAELAERVALLEGQRDTSTLETDEATRSTPQANDRPRSTRVDFAQRKEKSTRNISTRSIQNTEPNSGRLNTVVGVPEDDEEEALADRVLFIERRLENDDEEKSIIDKRKYALPESTFSLLITHHPLSVPFGFAMFTVALSIACLSLTLASSISDGTKGNHLGIPAGVDGTVRAAQFLGELIYYMVEEFLLFYKH